MNLINQIKHYLWVGAVGAIGLLTALVLLLKQDKQQAKNQINNMKRVIALERTNREAEQIIREVQSKVRNDADEIQRILETRKESDDRPKQFGDPRINDRLRQRTKDTE